MVARSEVFLSHNSADRETVKVIVYYLRSQAIPAWLDESNLVPGDAWVDGISQALDECIGCIVFLGPPVSSSGKSSLARAGLVASLRAGGLPGSQRWPQVIIRPWSDPLAGHSDPVRSACGSAPTASAS